MLYLQNVMQAFFFNCLRSGLLMQPPNKTPNNESISFCCCYMFAGPLQVRVLVCRTAQIAGLAVNGSFSPRMCNSAQFYNEQGQ